MRGGGLSTTLPGVVAAAFEASGGQLTAGRMMSDLGADGQVLAFTYRPGRPCLLRELDFDQVAANYPTVNVTKQQVAIPGYVESAAQTTTGWLAAHLGRRNYFLLSIAVFTVSSLLCGMATSLSQLILFRVIQGLAGGGRGAAGAALVEQEHPVVIERPVEPGLAAHGALRPEARTALQEQ